VTDALASTLDVFPTVAALAGLALPNDRYYDGIDLAPVLFDGSTQGHTTLFHPNNGEGTNGAIETIRVGDYKAKVGPINLVSAQVFVSLQTHYKARVLVNLLDLVLHWFGAGRPSFRIITQLLANAPLFACLVPRTQ